jgi:hypothetical protein
MSWDPGVPLATQNYIQTLTVGNTTQAKLLVPPFPGQVMNAVVGETALYGETSVRQRVFQGGQRIIDMYATLTDTTQANLLVHECLLTSSYSAVAASGMQNALAGYGTATIPAGQNAIIRTSGSFLAEGCQIGDAGYIFGDITTAANNGVLLQTTAVTSLTLSFTGTPLTAETIAAGFQYYKIGRVSEFNIPLSSGNINTAPNVPLFGYTGSSYNSSQNKSVDELGISLGANGGIAISVVANLSALPARLDVVAKALLY